MAGAREWSVACRDLDGRRRSVTILADQGKVVLMSPTGEPAVLSPMDVGRLRAALRAAIVSIEDPSNDDAKPPRTSG